MILRPEQVKRFHRRQQASKITLAETSGVATYRRHHIACWSSVPWSQEVFRDAMPDKLGATAT